MRDNGDNVRFRDFSRRILCRTTNLTRMLTREVTVRNRAGIHTRPASQIVREASRFSAEFYIRKDGYEINGKSIIGVMTLAAEQGATLELLLDGTDENEAADALEALFERGFGEPV